MDKKSLSQRSNPYFAVTPITTLIVDDHPAAADGLRSYLETDENIQVVAICHYGGEAIDAAARFNPHIAIVDLELDGSRIDGIEVARRLRRHYPDIKLLVISAYSDPQHVLGAVSAGVDGYLRKTSTHIEITQAVHAVMRGASIWDPQAHRIIQLYIGKDTENFASFAQTQYQTSPVPLTRREWETLRLLAAGHSNQSIANELVIAIGTVKTHVSNIYEKIRVDDRGQARVWYHINRHHYE